MAIIAIFMVICYMTASVSAFNIGATSGGDDIVKAGVVQDAYNETNAHEQDENTWILRYWIKLNNEPEPTVTVTLAARTAAKTNPSLSVLIPVPTFDLHPNGSPHAFDIQFTCLRPTLAHGDVVAIDATVGQVTVTFYVRKLCNFPYLNAGFTEGGSQLVYHGIAQPNVTYVLFEDVQSNNIFVQLDDESPFGVQSYQPRLDFDSSIIKVEWTAVPDPLVAAKTTSMGSAPSVITFNYVCVNTLPESTATISMQLYVHWGDPSRDIRVSWTKKCSSSFVEHPRPGLTIGTTREGRDVMIDGRIQQDWTVKYAQQVGENTPFLNFWISVNASEIGIRPRTQKFVVDASSDVDPITKMPYYDVHLWNASGIASADSGPVHFALWAICRSNGRSVTRIRVSFPDEPGNTGYDAISFYVMKTCTFPKLEMGLVEGEHSEIMKDGVLVPNWNYVESGPSTTFFFWLPTGEEKKEQTFRVHWYHYDNTVLSASRVVTRGHTARVLQLGTPEATVVANYTCRPDAAGKSAKINITVDIGWTQQFTIAWTKYCPTPEGSSGGWSAAGIFFFTVFMLTLVGCIAGCGYNRFAQNKRGFSIVPGNTYMTACYEKVVAPKKYTPQTDYSYDAAEEKSGTTGYQTDL